MKAAYTDHRGNLKFYVEDGWTKDELDRCCTQGSVRIKDEHTSLPFFMPNPKEGTQLDLRLLKTKAKLVNYVG